MLTDVLRILRTLNARLGWPLDRHEMADLRQDATLLVWVQLVRGNGVAPRTADLVRLCRSELQGRLRRKRRRSALHHLRSDMALDTVIAPVRAEDPLVAQVRHALAMLVESDRDVVRLKHFRGLTFEELSSFLGQPVSTIKSRYYRAVTRLEALLKPVRRTRRRETARPV